MKPTLLRKEHHLPQSIWKNWSKLHQINFLSWLFNVPGNPNFSHPKRKVGCSKARDTSVITLLTKSWFFGRSIWCEWCTNSSKWAKKSVYGHMMPYNQPRILNKYGIGPWPMRKRWNNSNLVDILRYSLYHLKKLHHKFASAGCRRYLNHCRSSPWQFTGGFGMAAWPIFGDVQPPNKRSNAAPLLPPTNTHTHMHHAHPRQKANTAEIHEMPTLNQKGPPSTSS